MHPSARLLLLSRGQLPRGHQGAETEDPEDLPGTETGGRQGTEIGEPQRAIGLPGMETEEQHLMGPETPAGGAQTGTGTNTIIWCTSAAADDEDDKERVSFEDMLQQAREQSI